MAVHKIALETVEKHNFRSSGEKHLSQPPLEKVDAALGGIPVQLAGWDIVTPL